MNEVAASDVVSVTHRWNEGPRWRKKNGQSRNRGEGGPTLTGSPSSLCFDQLVSDSDGVVSDGGGGPCLAP